MPPRLAVAGLAWATALDGQRWGVATVMSALRERDRSYRARVRTIASLLVMGVIVLGFGGVALRFQREELQLARVLELNELQREKEARLNQANRAATMLTFAAGLIPIAGNLVSNGVIVIVSLGISPWAGVGALTFLVVVHKAEYFLNARIVGSRIGASAWEILLAIVAFEVAFGAVGVVLAPIVYAWVKRELAERERV